MGAPEEKTVALGPVRHACHRCGACCTGWLVRLADFAERERLVRQATVLGVEEPIVDGVLRQVEGRCVFLGADNMCRIHGRFGASEKPLVCQLFPRRALKAEGVVRVGADPGCTSTWRTWKDGPLLDLGMIPSPRDEDFSLELVAAETGLVQLAGVPGMSVALYASVISGEGGAERTHLPGLPPAFAGRLVERLRKVLPHLRDADNGPLLGAELAPVAAALERLEPSALPPWAGLLTPESEGLALDVLRRTLFLRIGDSAIPPIAQTLLVLGGVFACAFSDARPERFGPALSAWSRVSRLEGFWAPMLPDTEVARWVLQGGAPPPG